MVCSICGQETYKTYALEGGELCRDCLLDAAEDPQVVSDRLPGFIAQHQKDFVDWLWAGDAFILDFQRRALIQQAVESWARQNPQEYREAEESFRTSRPGEWEDFLKNLKRSA